MSESYDYATAMDAVFTVLQEAWLQGTPELDRGRLLPLYWPGQEPGEDGKLDDIDRPRAHVAFSHTEPGRASLTGGLGGKRRYQRSALLTVQIRAPIADGQGLSLSQKLAKLVADAYEGKSLGSLWFRNVRVQEIGTPQGGLMSQRVNEWFQTNVYVECFYDEIK